MDETTIIPALPEPPPVFVDPSGRRRRLLRRVAYGFGVLGVGYTLLVGVSFAGGPMRPETIVPFVEPTEGPAWQPPPTLSPDLSPTAPASARQSTRPTPSRTGTPAPGTGATPRSSASATPKAPRSSAPATSTSPTHKPRSPKPSSTGPTGLGAAGE